MRTLPPNGLSAWNDREGCESVFSVFSCGIDHSEQVFVGGVSAALVAGGEDESAAGTGVVDGFFACVGDGGG